MLINISNHPSAKWQPHQKNMAENSYGKIFDISFPDVPAEADSLYILSIAREYSQKIIALVDEYSNESKPNAVHIQGEFTLTYRIVSLLKKSGVKCIASTSKRDISEENGKKVIHFNFVQFREY